MRLVRPVLPNYSEVNAHYRDTARRLSEVRDAHAAIETFDEYLGPAAKADGTLSKAELDDIRETLIDRRDELAAEQDLDQRLTTVRAELIEGRKRVPDLPVATDGYTVEGDRLANDCSPRNRTDWSPAWASTGTPPENTISESNATRESALFSNIYRNYKGYITYRRFIEIRL